MAREFWSEIYDVRRPVDDRREKRGTTRQKKVRVLIRRPAAAPR